MFDEWIYHKPALKFWEGLPLGTGRIASMLYGSTEEAAISVCDETLWSGCPYDPAQQMSGVRDKIFDALIHGRHGEAEELALSLRGCPNMVQQYRSMGRFKLKTGHANALNYVRRLNFMRGIASFEYDCTGHVDCTAFASYPKQLVCLKLKTDTELNIDGVWETEQPITDVNADKGTLTVCGKVNDAERSGSREYGKTLKSVLKWCCMLRIECEGETADIKFDGTAFSIRHAKSLTLYISCATSWLLKRDKNVGFITDNDPCAVCAASISACDLGFDSLLNEAQEDTLGRMSRFYIRLGDEKRTEQDTTLRMEQIKQGAIDDAYLAQYLMYSRYILICGARKGTLAFNNHNIWAEKSTDRWRGRWTLNINIQECYWICGPTGLEEEAESLLTLTELLASTGEKSARSIYGLEGWCAHHGTDIWFNTAPQDYATWHSTYPTAGIWLCNQLYDILKFESSAEYLNRLRPLIYGSARFALGLLKEYDGKLLSCPSSSPENFYVSPEDSQKCCGVTLGSTHDTALIRQLFKNFLELFNDDVLCAAVKNALSKLPDYRVGTRGEICEWFFDYEESPEEKHHRHISHLYGLYPANDMQTDDLKNAARRTLELRGLDNLGWAGAWRSAVYARLGDAECALDYQRRGTVGVSLHPSSADSSVTPSFEGNQAIQGWGAALCEMLVQSTENEIYIFPALPKSWRDLEIKGFGTRTGAKVDFKLENGKLTRLVLRASREADFTVYIPKREKISLHLRSGDVRTLI